jgi:phosphatidylethanolamine-binding protein (PEBP) family uncharacterized protein
MASAVLLAVAVAGCGSTAATSSTAEKKPRIAFQSSAVNRKGRIPGSFKCSESKVWIPMRWGALPADTKELILYVARFGSPTSNPGGTASAALLSQELIIGLKPTLHGLSVGNLPHGALIGTYEIGNKHVSIGPKKGSSEGVLFGLYALDHQQKISKGSQNGALLNRLRSEAVAVGTFVAGYS